MSTKSPHLSVRKCGMIVVSYSSQNVFKVSICTEQAFFLSRFDRGSKLVVFEYKSCLVTINSWGKHHWCSDRTQFDVVDTCQPLCQDTSEPDISILLRWSNSLRTCTSLGHRTSFSESLVGIFYLVKDLCQIVSKIMCQLLTRFFQSPKNHSIDEITTYVAYKTLTTIKSKLPMRFNLS
jgi:hypothetical protein